MTPDGSTVYVNSKVSENPNETNPVVVRVISGIPVHNEALPGSRDQVLLQITPNPSHGGATIRYNLLAAASVELSVYSLLGRRVVTLEVGARGAGEHLITWNGNDESGGAAAAGNYIFRLRTDDHVYSRLLTLVR